MRVFVEGRSCHFTDAQWCHWFLNRWVSFTPHLSNLLSAHQLAIDLSVFTPHRVTTFHICASETSLRAPMTEQPYWPGKCTAMMEYTSLSELPRACGILEPSYCNFPSPSRVSRSNSTTCILSRCRHFCRPSMENGRPRRVQFSHWCV